jgi:branched-chain amino acid transport system ATP-binding protein
MGDLLRTENVSKKFGGFSALNNVSITIPERRIDLLIGPNGSGKTTLLNCISGVMPYTGAVWFDDVCVTGRKPWEIVALGIGRTFQIPAPFKNMTVAENLLVCSKHHRGEDFWASAFPQIWGEKERDLTKKVLQLLKIVRLDAQRNALANQISGGQLKLLEIARLLMLDCRLLLLDEPIGGVNPVLAHELLSRIREIRDEFGTTFLLIEHRLDIAMQYADYVHVLTNGELAMGGPPDQVMNSGLYRVYV